MENTSDRMTRLADLLIKRGFAKSHIINETTGIGGFDWTPAGKSLQKHLFRLFDIQHTHPSDVDGHDIMGVVGLILFTGAPGV
jgi:hypothetical protein